MAKIQLMQEQQRIQPRNPVPVASSSRARIGAESQQAIGKGLMNLAGNIGQIEAEHNRKRKQAEAMKAKTAVDALSRNAYQDAIMNAKADGSDIRSLYLDSVNSGRAEILNGLDESVAEKVEQYSFGVDGQADKMLFNKSIRMAEKDIIRTYDEAANMKEALIMKDPELAAKYASAFELDAFSSTPEGGTPALMAELKPAYENRFASATMSGFHSKCKENAVYCQKGLAILQSSSEEVVDTKIEYTPGDAVNQGLITQEEADDLKAKGEKYVVETQTLSPGEGGEGLVGLMNSLDGKQRKMWTDRLQSGLKQKTSYDLSELNLQRRQLKTILQNVSNEGDLKLHEKKAEQIIDKYIKTPDSAMSKKSKAMNIAGVLADVSAATVSVQMRKAPRSNMNEMVTKGVEDVRLATEETLKGFGLDDEFTRDEMAIIQRKTLTLSRDRIKAEQKADASGYLHKTYPELNHLKVAARTGDPEAQRAYEHMVQNHMKYLQIPVEDQSFLTKADISRYGTNITAGIDAGTGPMTVAQFQQEMGLNFKEGMSDLIKSGAVPSGLMAVANMADPVSREKTLNLFQDRKGIETEWKSPGRISESDNTSFKNAMGEKMSAFSTAIHQAGQGGYKYINGFADLVGMEAKSLYLRGEESDVEDAVSTAYENIVSKNFNTLDGLNGKILVPKNDRHGKEIPTKWVESFTEAYSTAQAISVLEPSPQYADESESNQNKSVWANLNESERTIAFQNYTQKIAEHGKWKVDSAFGGLVLTYKGHEVRNISGEPIVRKWDEIVGDKYATAAKRDWNKKFWDAFTDADTNKEISELQSESFQRRSEAFRKQKDEK